MARNRLLPTHIFAILMMSVAFFLLITAGALHLQITRYDSSPDIVVVGFRNGFAIVGTALIILSIGLLTFQKWAILGFLGVFWLAGIAWVGVALRLAVDALYEPFVVHGLIGFSVLIYAALLSGILLLNNGQVLKLFREKQALGENAHHILDQP